MRSLGRLRSALLVVAVTTALAHVGDVRAQTVPGQEIARQLFDEGVRLEGAQDYAGALAKFREADQIRSTPALRFHKGLCLENLGKLTAALDEYEAAERAAREQNKTETLRSTKERLDALRPRVPQLSVRLVSPATGEITLDGVPVAAPLVDGKKFRIDPGEHVVVARAPEHITKTQRVALAEGAVVPVEITLERIPAGATAAPGSGDAARDVEAPTKAPGRSLVLPVAATAGAVVLLAGGVVAFALADAAQSDARATCPQKASCDDERAQVRTLDALSLAGFVGGAALGALSVVLWSSRPAREASLAPAIPWTRLRVGPRGVLFEGAL